MGTRADGAAALAPFIPTWPAVDLTLETAGGRRGRMHTITITITITITTTQ